MCNPIDNLSTLIHKRNQRQLMQTSSPDFIAVTTALNQLDQQIEDLENVINQERSSSIPIRTT